MAVSTIFVAKLSDPISESLLSLEHLLWDARADLRSVSLSDGSQASSDMYIVL